MKNAKIIYKKTRKTYLNNYKNLKNNLKIWKNLKYNKNFQCITLISKRNSLLYCKQNQNRLPLLKKLKNILIINIYKK